MSDKYIVNFIKDKDYKRFYATGVLTNTNNQMCSIDLFEETTPLMTKFMVDSNGDATTESEGGNLINYIHATVLIAPDNIPRIIDSLKSMYERHLEMKSGE